eukprot:jgi/Picsp_1/4963/NSC_02326-R1_---NA---
MAMVGGREPNLMANSLGHNLALSASPLDAIDGDIPGHGQGATDPGHSPSGESDVHVDSQ